MKTLEQVQADMIARGFDADCVMKMDDFVGDVITGCITDYDGVGYPHNGTEEVGDIDIFDLLEDSEKKLERGELTYDDFLAEWPYVCWYNK